MGDEQHDKVKLELLNQLSFNANAMRKNGVLTDVIIHCGDKTFNAHKMVLVASSRYFLSNVSLNLDKPCCQAVNLHAINPNSMAILLDFMYTGELDLNTNDIEQVQSVLDAAEVLEVDLASQLCYESVMGNMNSNQILSTLCKMADQLSTTVQNAMLTRLASSFLQICSCEDYVNLPVKFLLILLRSQEIKDHHQDQILEAVLNWVRPQEDARLDHLPALLSTIDTTGLTIDYIKVLDDEEPLVDESKELMQLIRRVKKAFRLQSNSGKCSTLSSRSASLLSIGIGSNANYNASSLSASISRVDNKMGASFDHLSFDARLKNKIAQENATAVRSPDVMTLHNLTRLPVQKSNHALLNGLLEPPNHAAKSMVADDMLSHDLAASPKLDLINFLQSRNARQVAKPSQVLSSTFSDNFQARDSVSSLNAPSFARQSQLDESNRPLEHIFPNKTAAVTSSASFSKHSYVERSCSERIQKPYSALNSRAQKETGRIGTGKWIVMVQGSRDSTNNCSLIGYDVFTGDWSEIQSFDQHILTASAICSSRGNLYFLGGHNNTWDVSNTMVVYDIKHNNWQKGPAMVTARLASGATVMDGQIYVVGGLGADNARLQSVERLSLSSQANNWKPVAPLIRPRECPSVAPLRGKLYVIGGYVVTEGRKRTPEENNTAVGEVYQPGINQWTVIFTPLPIGRTAPEMIYNIVTITDRLFALKSLLPKNAEVESKNVMQKEFLHEFDPILNCQWSNRLVNRHASKVVTLASYEDSNVLNLCAVSEEGYIVIYNDLGQGRNRVIRPTAAMDSEGFRCNYADLVDIN